MPSPAPATEVDPERAREALRAHLRAESVAHCERTAVTARALAQRHGVDPEKAELAGLLHDWTRDDPRERLVREAEDAGLTVTPEEREHPYLLHAPLAAKQLAEAFPRLPDDVLHAISAHTVGDVPMSDLDKVIYIADMIEPQRAYPGVERLREVARDEPLSEAFRECYAHTVRHVLETGGVLHPLSRAVVAEIERETGRLLPLDGTMDR